MRVNQVAPQYVVQFWPIVGQHLANGLEHSGGEYTADQLKVFLTTGEQALLVADDGSKGAASVQIIRFPNDTIAFVTAIGGRLIANAEGFSQLCEWAKSQGCTKVQGAARESIERLWRQKFGFSERYRIVEKTL